MRVIERNIFRLFLRKGILQPYSEEKLTTTIFSVANLNACYWGKPRSQIIVALSVRTGASLTRNVPSDVGMVLTATRFIPSLVVGFMSESRH